MRILSAIAQTLIAITMLGCATGATSPATPASSLAGNWTVVAGEHEGARMDVVVGGTLAIDGDRFRIRTASGNELQGRIEQRASTKPAQLDLVHDSGVRWIAIYALEGATLRLNYVDATGKDPRPTEFRTSGETEASLLTLERSP